jgi:hypothetical protein
VILPQLSDALGVRPGNYVIAVACGADGALAASAGIIARTACGFSSRVAADAGQPVFKPRRYLRSRCRDAPR